MATVVGVGLSDHEDAYASGIEAAQQAHVVLDNCPITMALLFTSQPNPRAVLSAVNHTLGHPPLVGATTAGQYTHTTYAERGTGIMLIASDQMQFYPLLNRRRWFGGQLRGLTDEGFSSDFAHRTLMLFPDDQSMNLNTMLQTVLAETGMMYDILGGAGLPHRAPPRPPAVFHGNQLFRSGYSGAEVLSQIPMGLALANGWKPLSGPYRITRANERQIIEIDGRPAREVYEDFLAEFGFDYTDDTLIDVALRHPIGVCEANGATCQVSLLSHFGRNGAIACVSPPKTGTLIYFLATQPDAMLTAAQSAISRAATGSEPHAGALFIDCASTGMVLADAYQQQRAVVRQQLGDIPFLGVRSHGVLAGLQGEMAGHYECSVATFLLPE